MGIPIGVIEVPNITCRESVEAEDFDETGDDESLLRIVERIREKRRKGEWEKILRFFFSQFEEGMPSC